MKNLNISYYTEPQSLMDVAKSVIVETDVALDIGCGIIPMNYFRPKLHIMAEPWHEYADILASRYIDDKSVLIIKLGALEILKSLQNNSVDSIFMLDVIEHLEKDVGKAVITEMQRVCRKQAIIFTPLGFMPQHMEHGETDAWGLSGIEMQEHKSGWLPEDFGAEWEFHVCETFHGQRFNGEQLEKPFGAFFAICNFEEKTSVEVGLTSDLRRPLPSELKVDELKHELFLSNIELNKLRESMREIELENKNLSAYVEELKASIDIQDKKRANSLFRRAISLLRGGK